MSLPIRRIRMLFATAIAASLAVLGLLGAGNADADASICLRTRVPSETSFVSDCQDSCNAPDISVKVTAAAGQDPILWTCVRTN